MSSNQQLHHQQQQNDPNYIIRLQQIRLNDGDSPSADNRQAIYNRIQKTNPNVLHSIVRDGQMIAHTAAPMAEYKIYERGITGAPKYTGPSKQVDHYQQVSHMSAVGNNSYYHNNSPTHSLSGSSQHSESPRTSMNYNPANYETRIGPVYENLDYYVHNAQQHHHQPQQQQHMMQQSHSQAHDSGSYYASLEHVSKKPQPQVAIMPNIGGAASINQMLSGGSRFAHTPQPPEVESPPIYENLHIITGILFCQFPSTHFTNIFML